MRKYKHLKYEDRLKIEELYKQKHTVIDIAQRIGVSRQTIYNELERGKYLKRRDSDWKDIECYSADIAEAKYQAGLEVRGTQLKIAKDHELAAYIEKQIIENHYSPEAIVFEIKNKGLQFQTDICFRTIYSYIDKGVFLHVTNKDLPCRRDKKRAYHKITVKEKKYGTRIDERPAEVMTREEFGNWEMDTVVGAKGKSKKSLLVLTERKTRREIVRLLPEHTASCVVEKLNELESSFGSLFSTVFRTITCDNGAEFAYSDEMEKSSLVQNTNRTKIYYCHPYSSWERGSNEVCNRLIRRHIPKGVNFDNKTDEEIAALENWINHYPRRQFAGKTAQDMYDKEILRLAG